MNTTTATKPKTFELGQICCANVGSTMCLPQFYKVVRLTKASIYFQPIHSQLIEHDGYGQAGYKLPVDRPSGSVFRKARKTWKDNGQEYAFIKHCRALIEPWNGRAALYDSYD